MQQMYNLFTGDNHLDVGVMCIHIVWKFVMLLKAYLSP